MRIFIILVIAAVAITTLPLYAQAQEKPASPSLLVLKHYEPTHPEIILMAFNKKAGLQPDFLEWAKNSPFLKDSKEIDRDAIINRESNRLANTYMNFNADEQIIVHSKITLDNYSTLQEILSLKEFSPQTFFSFSIYNQNVAIVPKDISTFSTIKMPKQQMEDMLKKSSGTTVQAEFILQASFADSKEPFVKDNKSYWLMLADIGEIRFWSLEETPVLLWTYRAQWFKPKEDRDLLNLKSSSGLL
jgi:hypothetical protein